MPKHFVITTCGTSGDVFPFIEIGKYLLSKNHRVSFVTNPYFENVVKTNGLKFVPFGTLEQCLDALNDPAMWDPTKGFTVFWIKTIQPNLHCIRLYIQSLEADEEVVILSSPSLMAVANLARVDRANLKVVLFYLYPAIIRTYFGRVAMGGPVALPKYPKALRKALYWLGDKMFDAGIMPGLNKEMVKIGLPKIAHYFPHLQSSADLYVTLFPEWYASTQPDYPKPLINGDFVRYSSVKEILCDELSEFLDAAQPPILFTPGSGNLHGKNFFEMAADVVRKLNARAVFLTKAREQLPTDLSDSVLWQEYVPFSKVLPRVSMIVHHGGIGTLAEASKAGVPQLLIPSAYDQFDNAMIIRDLGIGKSIPLQFLTRRKRFSQLSEIQSSQSIKDNCMNVSSNFRSSLEASQIMNKVLVTI